MHHQNLKDKKSNRHVHVNHENNRQKVKLANYNITMTKTREIVVSPTYNLLLKQ